MMYDEQLLYDDDFRCNKMLICKEEPTNQTIQIKQSIAWETICNVCISPKWDSVRPLSVLFYFVPQESHRQADSARLSRILFAPMWANSCESAGIVVSLRPGRL